MSTDSGRASLNEIAKATAAIVGVPLALFALFNTLVEEPVIALVLVLILATLASFWVLYSGWAGITEVTVAWLSFGIVLLSVTVIWPRTMTVEGIIRDTAGNPVSNEVVVLFDRSGLRYETRTNAEGHYDFLEVPIGRYRMQVRDIEIGGETKGAFVRVVQQNIAVPPILTPASPTPALTPSLTPESPTDTPVPFTDTPTPIQPSIPTDTPIPTFTPTPSVIVVDYCTDNGGGGTEIIPVEPPRTVAWIRIDLEERATEHGFSLWEVEAYGPDTGNTNLVTGGEARASSAQDSFGCEGCFADKAIDGDMNTRWGSDWRDGQWFEIALPGLQVVNRIVLRWEAAYARKYCVTVAERVIPTPTLAPCPPAGAEGTVPPAVAISSITFIVNGVEQVVDDFGSLQASVGEQVEVKEVTICADPFEDKGGQVYVEFDPVDQNGQLIAPEVKGTRAVGVTPGFIAIQGPNYTWTIGDWRHLSVVTVHYPPGGGTQNPSCEGGACEVDDRLIVPIQ